MNASRVLPILCAALLTCACSHPMSVVSLDGEQFSGRYRFGREGTGLMQIYGPENEVLIGRFIRVDRTVFAQEYEKAFGRRTIETDGPDLSRHVNALGGLLGNSSTFHETAYAEPISGIPSQSVSGPLFYWTASLQGDRRMALGCFLIGSAYTGHGFGRCKSQTGKEFHVDF
ncbi:MAG TPA: hypothetical protein VK200_16265 [Candidatus Limnocylindrales bacterium]|nr:hypothetical protein [Candidatus Limnocylindrales bacterium]